jgi:HSP20 family protein
MFSGRLFSEMDRLQREVELLCGQGQCVAVVPKSKEENVITSRIPVSHVYETENSVIVTIELPGVNKDNIELNLVDDRLEVSVNQTAEKEAMEKDKYSCEKRCLGFYRSLQLPSEVTSESAKATYKDGVLRVEILKIKKLESKKNIPIE